MRYLYQCIKKMINGIKLPERVDRQKKSPIIMEDLLWSWRDSNPRPNIFAVSFLHAYSGINCRAFTGTGQTNEGLS